MTGGLRRLAAKGAGVALALVAAGCGKVLEYPDEVRENSAALCSDGSDNDFDGNADCDDTDCDGFCREESAAECGDGRDNDGDGLVDAEDPRCWVHRAPLYRRCSGAKGVDLAETFDAGLQSLFGISPWRPGREAFVDFHQGRLPSGRQDLLVGFATDGVDALPEGGLMYAEAFAGSWQGFELEFDASVPTGAILRAAVVPIAVAVHGDPPSPLAKGLLSVTIDASTEPPRLTLEVDGAETHVVSEELVSEPSSHGPSEDFSSVSVALEEDGFHVTVARANGATIELPAVAPRNSPSLPPSRLVFWGASASVKTELGLDDVYLHVSPELPCGFPTPRIPGQNCDLEQAFRAFGHQIAVARADDGSYCALVTASKDSLVEGPEALSAWSSPDGVSWEPVSAMPGPSLVGAGIAYDQGAFHVVAAFAEEQGVRLAFADADGCGQWGAFDAFEEGPLLAGDAEAPSYVILKGEHRVYFTRPPGDEPKRTLWRVARDADPGRAEPEWLFDLPPNVESPVAIQRIGSKDLVLVHPQAPSADVGGIGALVSDEAGGWEPIDGSVLVPIPRLLRNAGEGQFGFDDFGVSAVALAWGDGSGFALYSGGAKAGFENSEDFVLSLGAAQIAPDEPSFPQVPSMPAVVCGDGKCEADETCSSCASDCQCSGPVVLTDAFDGGKLWELVSLDANPLAVQYVDPAHGSLNWAGASINDRLFSSEPIDPASADAPPTWSVLPLEQSIAGDFELSFDFSSNWIDPFPQRASCTLYVGVGTPPDLAAEEAGGGAVPEGVFARLSWSKCVGKYFARPSVDTSEARFEDDNETTGDHVGCLEERYFLANKTRHVRLQRRGNEAKLSVERDDGCGFSERSISYSAALPELSALLVGFGGGDFETCRIISGAGRISNLELRLLEDPSDCPDAKRLCSSGTAMPACVDVQTSNEHCGECGHACGTGERCVEGSCSSQETEVIWLNLEGDTAPDTPLNSDFAIDGFLRVSPDPCVAYEWDPETRCISGTLCEPGREVVNWGLAVDFNFRASETSISTWNPEEAGVRGLAWEISGNAPGLQAWVLDMDSKWNGTCDDPPECPIYGPPDGTPVAPLKGQLLFDEMVKDNWGPNGARFTFDPARVYALQLKIPAPLSPGEPFEFCVDRLGVIR